MNDLIIQHLDIWTSAIASKATAGRGTSTPSPKGEGRGEGNPTSTRNAKVTAYGIKKLRELILELAVRGKLVPQDPNDEPASVLLKKIEAEKKRLVNEGKLKKQNTLTNVNDEENPFNIPESWKWTKLADISSINPRNEANDETMVSFIPMSLITTLHTGEHEQEVREWKEIKSGYTHFANGDIGVAKITPCFENSKAVIFSNLTNGIGAGTTELHIARPYGNTICARYILIYLKSPQFLIIGESKMTGTAGQKRVPKDFFAENPLPLPPLAEQHRIVAKVDELMALCDHLEQQQTDNIAAHQTLVQTLLDTLTQAADAAEFEQAWNRIADHFDTLLTTEHSIDRLKQTLLQLAVMGKLVPQDTSDEDVQILLARNDLRRREVAEFDRRADIEVQSILSGNDRWQVPDSWYWRGLADLALFVDYRGKTPDKQTSGIRLITAKNVRKGQIDLLPEEFLSEKEYSEWMSRGLPKVGDVLFTTEAPMGNAAMVDLSERFALAQRVICFQLYGAMVPAFLVLQILSNQFQFILDKNGTGMTAKGIKASKLKQLPVAIPPLTEQHRIVARVDELMTLCDALKARIAAAQTTQIQLADAIVEQAVI